jgi:hypothetical protein
MFSHLYLIRLLRHIRPMPQEFKPCARAATFEGVEIREPARRFRAIGSV